jgi:hypothetical protein
MNERQQHPWQPAPEDLTAYVDGQLDARRRRELEAWLLYHPEMSAELEAHQRLARLWRKTSPESPVPGRWSNLHRKIFSVFAAGHGTTSARRPRRWWVLPVIIGAYAATGLLAIVILYRSGFFAVKKPNNIQLRQIGSVMNDTDPPATDQQVMEVLSDDEVEIITMDLRDSRAIIVGAPPLKGDLALLSPDEVEAVAIKLENGVQSPPEMNPEPAPMLWVPIRTSER